MFSRNTKTMTFLNCHCVSLCIILLLGSEKVVNCNVTKSQESSDTKSDEFAVQPTARSDSLVTSHPEQSTHVEAINEDALQATFEIVKAKLKSVADKAFISVGTRIRVEYSVMLDRLDHHYKTFRLKVKHMRTDVNTAALKKFFAELMEVVILCMSVIILCIFGVVMYEEMGKWYRKKKFSHIYWREGEAVLPTHIKPTVLPTHVQPAAITSQPPQLNKFLLFSTAGLSYIF